MELEFDVHVDANALYDYMLRHTFTKAAGILGSTAGALGIVAGMMQRYPIYVIFGAVVLLYTAGVFMAACAETGAASRF